MGVGTLGRLFPTLALAVKLAESGLAEVGELAYLSNLMGVLTKRTMDTTALLVINTKPSLGKDSTIPNHLVTLLSQTSRHSQDATQKRGRLLVN